MTPASYKKNHTLMGPHVPFYDDRVIREIRSANSITRIHKVDIRFKVPNSGDLIDPSVLHSLEHLCANALYEIYPQFAVDISPMGCRTGLYMVYVTTTPLSGREPQPSVERVMFRAAEIDDATPTELSCGAYLSHNFEGARKLLEECKGKWKSFHTPDVTTDD